VEVIIMAELDIRDKEGIRLGLIGARKNARLTQSELAKRVYISRSHLASLELGTRNASDDVWKRLKKELRVKSVEELWERFTYKEGYFHGDDGNKIKDPKYFKYTDNEEVDDDVRG